MFHFARRREDEAHGLPFVASPAEAQPQPVAVPLDPDDLQRDDVVLLHHLLGVGDAAVDELGDVNEPFHGTLDASERTEGHKLGDRSRDHLPHVVLIDNLLPQFRSRPPQAEGDLLGLLIHLHYVYVDLVAHLEHLFGRLVALPGEFREMGEAVGPSEVDEYAKAADAADPAASSVALS